MNHPIHSMIDGIGLLDGFCIVFEVFCISLSISFCFAAGCLMCVFFCQRDVPARYLLRLGQGEQELATDLDFSRQGRVNAMLVRRLELLGEVSKLARSLRLPEDVVTHVKLLLIFGYYMFMPVGNNS